MYQFKTAGLLAVNDIGAGDPSIERSAEPIEVTGPSVSIAPADARVLEGAPAAFTLARANDDTASSLALTVRVSQTGSVLVNSTPGPLTVRFAANEATKTLALATDDDNVVEDDGLVLFPLEYALYRIFVSPVSHSRASRNPELEAAFQYQHI